MSGYWVVAFASLAALAIVEGVILLGLVRRISAVLEHTEGAISPGQVNLGSARPGMLVEPFHVVDRRAEQVDSAELISEPAVIVQMHSGCGPCRQLVERLPRLRPTAVPIIVVLDDSDAARELELPPAIRVLFDAHGEASQALHGGGTPQAFAITARGELLETLVPGSPRDLEDIARRLAEGGGVRDRTSNAAVHAV